jgi:membrane-associated protein
MELIRMLIDFVLHLDKHLAVIINTCGNWTYLVFFLVIFCETGLVVTPFLPGDSLLFALGAFAATGVLDPHVCFLLLALAAVLGNTTNYWIGAVIGPRVFHENSRFLNKKHLEDTHRFYEKHGGKTIIITRFIPILRTFAPFVAGIGKMSYWRFGAYNLVGGVLWAGLFIYAGYYFGNLPLVKRNFTLVIFAIIFISLLPAVIEFLRQKYKKEPVRNA